MFKGHKRFRGAYLALKGQGARTLPGVLGWTEGMSYSYGEQAVLHTLPASLFPSWAFLHWGLGDAVGV